MHEELKRHAGRNEAAGNGWAVRLERWRNLAEECGRKPSRGRVHALRVVTLRLQAELETWLADAGEEHAGRRAAKRWLKQAERLREALKDVREADVSLGVLGGLRNVGELRRRTVPRQCRACREESRKLKSRLERLRKDAAEELAEVLEKWSRRHAKLSRELETALGPEMAQRKRPDAADVRRMVEATARDFPVLAEENLHAYRKRLKEARYAADLGAEAGAEAGAETDEVMRRQAALLCRMQTVAGDWHDWDALARMAERMLSDRKHVRKLVETLDTVAEAKLSKALSYCRRMTARLLRHSAEAEADALPPKKPVVRAEAALEPRMRRASGWSRK